MLVPRGLLGTIAALACLALVACSGLPSTEPPAPQPAVGSQPRAEPQPSEPIRSPGEHTATGGEGPNVFSADAVRPGDTVAGLTVMEVAYQAETAELPFSAIVSFSGQVTVTGTYVHHPQDEEFVGGEVCMHNLDAASQARLPRLRGDQRVAWFCFANTEETRRALVPEGVGTATVVIDHYTIDYRPTETWNRARLVRAVEVRNGRPWTQPVTLRIEGMEETKTYRLLYLPILPFTTYTPPDWTAESIQEQETVGVRLRAPHDIGFVEVVFFAPGTPREQVDAAVAERLDAYPESQRVEPPPWAVAAFAAADRTPKEAAQWRTARLWVGQRSDRFFTVLSHLERFEAGDGWGPTADAVLKEWRWWDTGEPLDR
ncbi:MAG TPA: hypothetical protein VIL95_04535 [Bacillota bacterium]